MQGQGAVQRAQKVLVRNRDLAGRRKILLDSAHIDADHPPAASILRCGEESEKTARTLTRAPPSENGDAIRKIWAGVWGAVR